MPSQKKPRVARPRRRMKGPACSENGILGFTNRQIGQINRRRREKEEVARAQAHDEGPDEAALMAAGWRKVTKTNINTSAWCWREPKTRALYKLKDALAILYFAHRARPGKAKEASKA